MPLLDTQALLHRSIRLDANGSSFDRATFTGPIALAVIVFVGVTFIFIARYILHRRRLRLARECAPFGAPSSDQSCTTASAAVGRPPAEGNAVDSVGDFNLDSWRVESGNMRGESGSLHHLRQPPEVALARSFRSLGGSMGSLLRAGLCVGDDDGVEANSVCPICLDSLRRGVRKAPCGHKYHGACMRNWVAKVHDWHCPLCVAGGLDRKRGRCASDGVVGVQRSMSADRLSV